MTRNRPTPERAAPGDESSLFDRLTPRQREVLGMIAINEDGGHHPRTLKTLAERGLIESYPESRRDRMGTFMIARYRVPIAVHIAWCEWCCRQPEVGEPEDESQS